MDSTIHMKNAKNEKRKISYTQASVKEKESATNQKTPPSTSPKKRKISYTQASVKEKESATNQKTPPSTSPKKHKVSYTQASVKEKESATNQKTPPSISPKKRNLSYTQASVKEKENANHVRDFILKNVKIDTPPPKKKELQVIRKKKDITHEEENDPKTIVLHSSSHEGIEPEKRKIMLDDFWSNFRPNVEKDSMSQKELQAYNNAASVAYALKDFEKAAIIYEALLQFIVDDQNILSRIAFCYYQIKGYEKSAEFYKRAVIKGNYESLSNQLALASCFVEMKKYHEAIGVYNATIRRFKEETETYLYKAIALSRLGKMKLAFDVLDMAEKINSNDYYIYMQRGIMYKDQDEHHKAIEQFTKALHINDQDSLLWGHRASARQSIYDEVGSLKDYYKGLTLDPKSVSISFNTGWQLLRLGYWREGLELYSRRMERPDFLKIHNFPTHVPLWNGGKLDGKNILLHAEQGFGDSIMMVRYCKMIKEYNPKTIIIECGEPLHEIFIANDCADIIIDSEERDNVEFDFHLPLMELAKIFHCTVDNIPFSSGYLSPASDGRLLLKKKNNYPNIGLVWNGSPLNPRNNLRSINLKDFKPILDIENCNFISLQRGKAVEEIAHNGWKNKIYNLGNISRNFYDASAIMQQCHFIISICSAPIHLAGALQVPSLVLLDAGRDWRWVARTVKDGRVYSNWYDSVEMLERKKEEEIESFMIKAKERLIEFLQQ